jgi:hypothetical protein
VIDRDVERIAVYTRLGVQHQLLVCVVGDRLQRQLNDVMPIVAKPPHSQVNKRVNSYMQFVLCNTSARAIAILPQNEKADNSKRSTNKLSFMACNWHYSGNSTW